MIDEPPIFLTLDEVLELHGDSLDEFGGSKGVRDLGLLESALASARNAYFYGGGDLYDVAAAYAFHVGEAQAFIDGNKRTAVCATLAFLMMNGVANLPSETSLHEAMIGFAEHRFDKPRFAAMLRDAGSEGTSSLLESSRSAVVRGARRDTKIPSGSGPVDFGDLTGLENHLGLIPVTTMHSGIVGTEVVLNWIVPQRTFEQLRKVGPIGLFMCAGFYGTAESTLMWILACLSRGDDRTKPLYTDALLVDPHSTALVEPLEDLANQTHWHLVLRGPDTRVGRVLEYPNRYGLERTLRCLKTLPPSSSSRDFESLRKAFAREYPVEALRQAALEAHA